MYCRYCLGSDDTGRYIHTVASQAHYPKDFSSSLPLCSYGLKKCPESRSYNSTGIPVNCLRTKSTSQLLKHTRLPEVPCESRLVPLPSTHYGPDLCPVPSQPVSCSRISLSRRLISKEGRPLTQHSPERRLLWSLAAGIISRSKGALECPSDEHRGENR